MREALHSNLVIFKLAYRASAQLPSQVFTFQSGYIQMSTRGPGRTDRWCLYIPIWLYSNDVVRYRITAISLFTFQSGYIQMALDTSLLYPLFFFTFQSGYIQMIDDNEVIEREKTLHSNLVIFKCGLR